MDPIQQITLWIAIYGAVLGTAGTIISGVLAYNQLTKDERQILMLVDLPMGQHSGKLVITNVGHRPITLTEISIMVVRVNPKPRTAGASLMLTTGTIHTDRGDGQLPKTLTDGESLGIPLEMRFTKSIEELRGTLVVIARDSEGREYTKYKKGRDWDLLHSN